jgi:NhaA family Na+:H+ antiporter
MARKAAARRPLPQAVVAKLLTPAQEFIRTESASGVLLIAAAALAFAWANSPWAASYFAVREIPLSVGFGAWSLEKPLLLWVNDLLMAIFFFVIGLEIKREIQVGELAGWQRASLPAAGALGGMLVPALIYVGFNPAEPALRGWAVPMATDIAFALGVLALLGQRVPLSLKMFLLALAIVDDLGAVLVIALFYTADVNGTSLLISLLVWGGALAYGRAHGEKPLVFALLGLVMWYFMLKSGVHATIEGVLMALAVPLRHKVSTQVLQNELRAFARESGGFEQVEMGIGRLAEVLDKAHSPLHRMEHALAPYVAFLVMPGRRRLRVHCGHDRSDPAAGRYQLVRHDRRRAACRHRLHHVAVHRQSRLRGPSVVERGQDRRAERLGGRIAGRPGFPQPRAAATAVRGRRSDVKATGDRMRRAPACQHGPGNRPSWAFARS